ncbi:cystatin-A-like [Mytilus trossulus]|uniref:cystatin-A-like n=1 Tax=Mytilus trossulus TaxID=6551 RepID=UPI003007DC34
MGQCYEKQSLLGGYSEEKRSDADVQKLVDNNPQMILAVKGALNIIQTLQITSLTYRTQVVAGTNYIVKVKTQDNDYMLLRIFQPLPEQGKAELVKVEFTQPIPSDF